MITVLVSHSTPAGVSDPRSEDLSGLSGTLRADMPGYARALRDLAVPPASRLEALKGDLAGFHGMRINGPWRIIFRWTESGPADAGIRDGHGTTIMGRTR